MGNASLAQIPFWEFAVHPHVCGERGMVEIKSKLPHGSSPRVWGTLDGQPTGKHFKRFIPTCVGNAAWDRRPDRMSAVHPHVCGERLYMDTHFFAVPGSSPRVWGTRLRIIWAIFRLRFIPTCVGNASATQSENKRMAVHPHVCGERQNRNDEIVDNFGSSPRVWGTLLPHPLARVFRRFIPTCVGNALRAENLFN